jgi:hypothetical protein
MLWRMSVSSSDNNEHLMVSFIDRRVALDSLARLVHEPAAEEEDEVVMFPFDEHPQATGEPVIGYSVPPAPPA